MSEGWKRITCASGRPTSNMMIPENTAVSRQPNVSSDITVMRTTTPPIAMPPAVRLIAVERFRSNHSTAA